MIFMNDKEKFLIDKYAHKAALFSLQYEMMGRLLDKDRIHDICFDRKWSEIFIYGGSYIGIQAFFMFSKFINVKAIVDRKRKLRINQEGVKVINIDEFYGLYSGEPVVITALRYANEIERDLNKNINSSNIFLINELL